MTGFDPDSSKKSPDRMDALVWGVTYLTAGTTVECSGAGEDDVNSLVTFSGTASDANQVTDVYIWTDAFGVGAPGDPASGDFTGWTGPLPDTYSWNDTYNSRGNNGSAPLRADDVTVATLLKKAGYATGGFGKWGIGGRGSTGVPEKHGFDVFFGYYHQVHAHSFYPPYLIRNSKEVLLPGNRSGDYYNGKTYAHHDIYKEAVHFIGLPEGNTALAQAARLGCDAQVLSLVGDDEDGRFLRRSLRL